MHKGLEMEKLKEKKKRKPLPPHWYFTYHRECVLCGYTEITRIRMYTPKPKDPAKTYEFEQFACGCHFC